jgi:formylmethanofuran dehydrogenase subunit E
MPDREISAEMTKANYWEVQADMWHQNYKEAVNEIERMRGIINDDRLEGAADEIERLRKDYALAWENHLLHEQLFVLTEAKIERLRKALQSISNNTCCDNCQEAALVARAALKEKE